MKFAEIENIWTAALAELSNADKGRVYYERAKQIITAALADPADRAKAVLDGRFRRDYLIQRIGAAPAVTGQNPRIKKLLADTDAQLAKSAPSSVQTVRPIPGDQSPELGQLTGVITELKRQVEVQQAEIIDLRRQLREAGWAELKLSEHGRLPW